jgi:ribosomal protein S18 acetylase RimI-like enzyme
MIIEPAKPEDRQGVLAVTAKIDIFTDEEKDTVRELWDEPREYKFLVARHDGQVIGYTCYDERALTEGTYDLYWIAVDPSARRLGAGKALMRATEADVKARGGRLILAETSGMDKYESTRAFYEGVGYAKAAVIRDFYKPGDDLVIYSMYL